MAKFGQGGGGRKLLRGGKKKFARFARDYNALRVPCQDFLFLKILPPPGKNPVAAPAERSQITVGPCVQSLYHKTSAPIGALQEQPPIL